MPQNRDSHVGTGSWGHSQSWDTKEPREHLELHLQTTNPTSPAATHRHILGTWHVAWNMTHAMWGASVTRISLAKEIRSLNGVIKLVCFDFPDAVLRQTEKRYFLKDLKIATLYRHRHSFEMVLNKDKDEDSPWSSLPRLDLRVCTKTPLGGGDGGTDSRARECTT